MVRSTSLRDAYHSLSSLWRLHRRPIRNYISVAKCRCADCSGPAHRALHVRSCRRLRNRSRCNRWGTRHASHPLGVPQLAAIAQRRGVHSSSIAGRPVVPPVISTSNSEPTALGAWWSTAPAVIAHLWSGAAASATHPRSLRSDERSGVGNGRNGRRAAPQLHVPGDAGQWPFGAGDDCGQDAQIQDSRIGGRSSDARLVAI